jgi:aryl-alcohol dehydrogenase-like predicted oxidoreductase
MVRTRRLGTSGPHISVLGLGTWAIGGPYRFGWGPVDDEESIATIRSAVERGINWIDTAAVYGLGHSEEVVGRALCAMDVGRDVYVFTKCGLNWYESSDGTFVRDLRPDSIRFECDMSLRRLGVERIDLYQIHWPDPRTGTPIEDSWATMLELAAEGKVRWVGVSNFDTRLLDACEAVGHVDSLQPLLNLVDRGAASEVIPWCREHGTGVVAYSPLASGLLTGKYGADAVDTLAPDDWRRGAPEFNEPRLSRNLALVARLRNVAARLGTTPAAAAVAWTLTVPGVTGTIVGARSPSQLDGWLEASELGLGDETLAELDAPVDQPYPAS